MLFSNVSNSSAKFRTNRPSPSAMESRACRASGCKGRSRPYAVSALPKSSSNASSSKRFRTSTWQRDNRAAFNSNEGFSVVAPTKIMVPSSTYGRNPSCCDRLNRWISSTNNRVPCPLTRRLLAAVNALRKSATPEKTADSCTKYSPTWVANSLAMVVLPLPGGPHKTREANRHPANMRWIAPSSANK